MDIQVSTSELQPGFVFFRSGQDLGLKSICRAGLRPVSMVKNITIYLSTYWVLENLKFILARRGK
jgi:hypothetical protein